MGRELARRHPVEADIVVPVPDSGNYAALGFSEELDIPYNHAFVRNHYIGRTFLQPTQLIRDFNVRVKLNLIKEAVTGKRVVVVDDSIVRGTTARARVVKLREAGAKEVHMRISCPPHRFACHYGIDFPDPEKLLANQCTLDEIRKYLGADSIGYLDVDGMVRATGQPSDTFCLACFNGEYPVPFDAASTNSSWRNDWRRVRLLEKEERAPPMRTAVQIKAYAAAGVDVDLGNRSSAASRRSSVHPRAGGARQDRRLRRAVPAGFRGMREPVLVSSVDGVGTKLKVAFASTGTTPSAQDLVNHCVNDIAVLGARPLFFLDYIGAGKLEPAVFEQLLSGFAKACKAARLRAHRRRDGADAGHVSEGEYDLAGTIVGVVDRAKMLDGSRIRPGDVILGLPSNGLHTNGYSLAQKSPLRQMGLKTSSRLPELRLTLGEELLRVHRNYQPLLATLAAGMVKGLRTSPAAA